MRITRVAAAHFVAAVLVAACGSSDGAGAPTSDASPAQTTPLTATPVETDPQLTEPEATDNDQAGVQMFPDVIGAVATQSGDTWTIAATLSSPYDSPERYADAFRILAPDGTVLGERILTHDHADEQPFTRSHSGVVLPGDVSILTIEGRDLEYGYGGEIYQLTIVR